MKIRKIGFEFEVLVKQKEFQKVWEAIYKISKRIRLGGDTSVKDGFGWKDLEIKTDAIPEKSAMILFHKIIDCLVSFNSSGVIKTNATCGLHINISTESIVDSYFQILERYDDKKYLKMWKRLDNPACPPLTFRENKKKYDNDLWEYMSFYRGQKYHSVALRDADNVNGIRLENRIIGGKDYILKREDLQKTIGDFLDIVKSGVKVYPYD